MSIATVSDKALLVAPKAPKPPAAETLVRIARQFGVNPLRQWKEMIILARGPGKLAADEYVSTGAFKAEFDMDAKKEFLGKTSSTAINEAANNRKFCATRGFVADKALYTYLLNKMGFRAAHNQAVAHTRRRLGDIPVLSGPDDIVDFLQNRAAYPLFGKPINGSGSIGSVLIRELDASSGTLKLGNGRDIDMHQFAREAVADYPEGFLFQSALRQHPELTRAVGDAVGALRILTIREKTGISVLYTLWKIPSPSAMSDNYWQDGSMIALIGADGQIEKCMTGAGPEHRALEAHPTSGVRVDEIQMPDMAQAQQLAIEAHSIFPEFGVVGWDMAMCEDGPTIIEANDNPYHVLYQVASGRGARNAEFGPRFEAVAAETKRMIGDDYATYKAREKAKMS